ncbi:hypothetical protein [Halorubrum ezzemoulense]|uniref:hypothetical protein n=1 Tax=Halorubrum ezzemoulense TaxID=337243 RepID=UPI00200B84AC|nr:hypothetical protein [Halorubrum ezzemoulense]
MTELTMLIDSVIAPAGDALGALGFIGAAILGYKNQRDSDAESAFWMAFSFASTL